MKQVSVVVASYRRDKELHRALNSLAKQTYANMEIVLVDDNFDKEWNKRVANIVEIFKKENPTLLFKYIVNSSNQGSARTRNTGIQVSNGEYITFLDDDDIYMPEKIKKQVEFMENSGSDYSVTDLELFNENGKLIDRRVRSYIKDTAPESLERYHLKYHITGTDSIMFKKEYLLKIGCFTPIDAGDEFYLIHKAIQGGGKFGYLPGCEIKAYVHTGEDGGLSCGEGKIKGENALYQYKKSFINSYDAATIRYIRMRHYAVLAFAEIRRKKYMAFLKNGCISFMCAPFACLKMLFFER